MKKVEGLLLDQDDIATAVCEFVAKVHPEYAEIQMSDVQFVMNVHMYLDDVVEGDVAVQVRAPKKDDELVNGCPVR